MDLRRRDSNLDHVVRAWSHGPRKTRVRSDIWVSPVIAVRKHQQVAVRSLETEVVATLPWSGKVIPVTSVFHTNVFD